MKLVYQSYRTSNVPRWINRCLHSVKNWAAGNEYGYRFTGDEIFDMVPEWYFKKVNGNIQLATDLARLVLARKYLEEGFDEVIWVDADMLVFDPEHFNLHVQGLFSFCREIWMDQDLDGNVIHQEKINNSISVFKKGNTFLDFYHDACLRIVDSREELLPVSVGTEFLTNLNALFPLPLLLNVGIISPALAYDLVHNGSRFIKPYIEWHGQPVMAANLCGSKESECFAGLRIDYRVMDLVAEKLLAAKGFPA